MHSKNQLFYTLRHAFSPAAYFILIFLSMANGSQCSFLNLSPEKQLYTIVINPAGDAHNPGRLIDDSFERTITLAYAQELKNRLEKENSNITVVLTRFAGQAVAELHNANFANRLQADLFLSIHFYQETEVRPHMFIYQFSYQPHMREKITDFSLYTFDRAYLFSQDSSQAWAQLLYSTSSHSTYTNSFTAHEPIKLPCEPLIGITTPAIMLDIGIRKKSDWSTYIEPLIQTIMLKVGKKLL